MTSFKRTQSCVAAALTTLALVSSCEKAPTTSPQDLGTEVVSDPTGTVSVDIALVARPGGESELRFTLKAVGTDEMDKLALDIATDNMFLMEGGSQWSGFVPPRQTQSHRVVVKPVDNAEDPHVRVKLSRFHDSEVLMLREVHFTPEGALVPE